MGCQKKAVIDTAGFLPACEERRKRYYELTARRERHIVYKTTRVGWGVDADTPDEMAACLGTVHIPSAIVQPCCHIERQNTVGRVFCVDTKFARYTPKDGERTISIPFEIAVCDFNGELVIDTLIRYDQSIEELLADALRTGLKSKFSWNVVRRIYGRETQTSSTAIDDIRDILFNTGMNSNSDLVEWSTSGTDRPKLKMIIGEHTPKDSILLPIHWRKVLPGFLSMSLSYFNPFLYPASKLHERAHRAGPDTLMLIDTIRALVDLYHQDEELAQSTLQINEEILHPQERLRKKRSVDDDHDKDDDVDSDDQIEMLDMESAAKQAVKEMTEDDKALLALFEECRGTQRSAHGATAFHCSLLYE